MNPNFSYTPLARDWIPNPGPQTWILQRQERELFFGGSRVGGKTEAGLAWMAAPEYINHPLFHGLVMRKDLEDLNGWLFRARTFYKGLANITGKPAQIHWKAGGVTEVGHWKDKDSISRHIGQEYHKILCEELTQTIKTLQEYQMLLGSLRSSVQELRPQFMGNANPGGPGHGWVKAYFVDKCKNKTYIDPESKSSRIFIVSKYTDNPKVNSEYVDYLKGMDGALGKAWRDGDWEAFKGQFFSNFGAHLKEMPFRLEPYLHASRVYGSFDYGCGQNGISSFGLWYVDEGNVPHRCYTHTSRGMVTASEQAAVLVDYIGSFNETCGIFPKTVFYDGSMDSKAGMEEKISTADYFKNAFKKYGTTWVPANKSRVTGWQTMLDFFGNDIHSGLPKMKYWEGYNDDFVNSIPDLVSDPNNPNDVEKCCIDHWAEECRYGLVGIRQKMYGFDNADKAPGTRLYDFDRIMQRMEMSGRLSECGLN